MCVTSLGYLSNKTLCLPFLNLQSQRSKCWRKFKYLSIYNFSQCWKRAAGVTPTFLQYWGVAGIVWCGAAARVAQEHSLPCVLLHCLACPSYIVSILGHWRTIKCCRSKCVKLHNMLEKLQCYTGPNDCSNWKHTEKWCMPVSNSHLLSYSKSNVDCVSGVLFHDPFRLKPRTH